MLLMISGGNWRMGLERSFDGLASIIWRSTIQVLSCATSKSLVSSFLFPMGSSTTIFAIASCTKMKLNRYEIDWCYLRYDNPTVTGPGPALHRDMRGFKSTFVPADALVKLASMCDNLKASGVTAALKLLKDSAWPKTKKAISQA